MPSATVSCFYKCLLVLTILIFLTFSLPFTSLGQNYKPKLVNWFNWTRLSSDIRYYWFPIFTTTTTPFPIQTTTTKSEPKIRNFSKPIKNFHYHALAKTGSTATRNEIKRFCKDKDLVCLTYCQCGYCTANPSYASCAEHLSENNGVQTDVTSGYITRWRLENGCCKHLDILKANMTAVVDHFPLYMPENQAFLKEFLPKPVFRFTIMREPVAQFLSYYHMTLTDSTQKYIRVPGLDKLISMFYKFTPDNTDPKHRLNNLHTMMTNSQAKDLGWREYENNIDSVLQYVESMDFVGIMENMQQSWRIAHKLLGWPGGYLEKGQTKGGSSSMMANRLSPEQRSKIESIQHADIALYKKAKERFAYFADLEKNGLL